MFTLQRWNKQFIVQLLAVIALLVPISALAISRTLPDSSIDQPGSSNLFLEIGRSGNGNSLQAPKAYAKFAFTNGNYGNVRIYDGAWCSGSNFDTNGAPTPTSCTAAQSTTGNSSIYYTIYPINANGGLVTSGAAGCKTSIKKYAWELAVNATSVISAAPLCKGSADSTGAVFVYLEARFYNLSPGVGGVDAFKVAVDPGAGYATYDSSDSGASDQPLSVQHRPLAANTGTTDTITFQFGPGCTYPATGKVQLHWYDADAGGGNQPGNITWQFIDDGDGIDAYKAPTITMQSSGNVTDATGFSKDMGGDQDERFFSVNIRVGHHYRWRWTNVDTHNGVQVYLPFDGYNYTLKCQSKAVGTKVDQNYSKPGILKSIPVTLYKDNGSGFVPITGSGANPQATANFTFAPLNQGTYQVRVPSGSLPAGVTYTGYTICINKTTCHKTQAKNPSTNVTPINVISPTSSFSVPAGGYADIWFHFNVTSTAAPVQHKIFAVNGIHFDRDTVRDNEDLAFDVLSYIFPDAGLRSSVADATKHLWLSGIWCDAVGIGTCKDQGVVDSVRGVDINRMTTINSKAEANCPNSVSPLCLDRVPLAYVPESDGTTNSGNTTPEGNNWMTILQESFDSGYTSRLGGIASNDNSNIGGYTGNHLKQVQISNIRIGASNPTTTFDNSDFGAPYQGKQTAAAALQADARSINLPTSSQNDPANGGTGTAGMWDNVLDPRTDRSNKYTGPADTDTLDFTTGSGGAQNFTFPTTVADAINRMSGFYAAFGGSIPSLLQDGHGNGYRNPSEPLTLTGGVTNADVSLKWDEFDNWTQVDDKGHYYPTKQVRATGFAYGATTNQDITVFASHDAGSKESTTTTETKAANQSYSCPSPVKPTATETNPNTVNCYIPGDPGHAYPPTISYSCGTGYSGPDASHNCSKDTTTYTACSNTAYYTGVQRTSTTYTYYTSHAETQYGWRVTGATTAATPRGTSNGATVQSYFGGAETGTPYWASSNSALNFWQDPSVGTSMDFSGSSNTSSVGVNQWVYDTSDGLYANRQIFNQKQTVTPYTGWEYTTTTYCDFPNHSTNDPTTTVKTGDYYANAKVLLENDTTVADLGRSNFTEDGSIDGQVDTDWAWASSKQRVQYAQTYYDHSRDLGSRALAAATIPCLTGGSDTNSEKLFFGLSDITGDANDCWARVGRSTAIIYNPTISVANGDVFSGRNLDSYFSSSSAGGSAFTFENGTINRFNTNGNFANYYLNPDNPNKKSVRADYCLRTQSGGVTSCDPSVTPAEYVFKNFAALKAKGAANGSPNYGNLGGKVYYIGGDATIDSAQLCGGSGTIIVEGNLTISGSGISYCGYSGSSKTQVPSVGFIVLGNIHVNPSVTNMVGNYFANGFFDSGSLLLENGNVDDDGTIEANDDRVSNDSTLTVSGLVVANSFYLMRQPSGAALKANSSAENFYYDGRIVVNTPPGFTDVLGGSAAWNETVPLN